ncbi:hypothetical protein SDC9_65915 [bioreactor metagenome]|uniref:Uncharacterized protein n=1 Tax=bioreactor metagenome TaxID=1076179 RepID=A0A644XTS4_9ZZZZ
MVMSIDFNSTLIDFHLTYLRVKGFVCNALSSVT